MKIEHTPGSLRVSSMARLAETQSRLGARARVLRNTTALWLLALLVLCVAATAWRILR